MTAGAPATSTEADRTGSILLRSSCIAAAVFWIFYPSLRGEWLVDDDFYLAGNSLLNDPARLWKAWFQPGTFIEYYPVEQTVQWLQWKLWHTDTFGYHLTNVVLHLVNALLVWRLLEKFRLPLAWVGGLLFAVHPAVVESVAWISELKNTLSLAPFLLALCAWIDYEETKEARAYARALGFFLLAMLCKISMATFPFVILLYAWWRNSRIGWNDLKASLPFFLVSLVLGITTILAGQWYMPTDIIDMTPTSAGGFLSKLILAGITTAFYFTKCVLPVTPSFSYPEWDIAPHSALQLAPWLVMIGLVYFLWRKRQTWGRHALLGLGFFFIMLAPFLGFNEASYMQFTWVMDHFLYIPMIGLAGLAIAALGHLDGLIPRPLSPALLGVTGAALGVLTVESHVYASVYINSDALWTHTLQIYPASWAARYNLGYGDLESHRFAEAKQRFEETIAIEPQFPGSYYHLGDLFVAENKLPEAIAEYEKCAQLVPNYFIVHYRLGLARMQVEHYDEAIREFQTASRLYPYSADTHFSLGLVWMRMNAWPEAIDEFIQVERLNPKLPEAYYNHGLALVQSQDFETATKLFREALELRPDYLGARINLGCTLIQSGHPAEAVNQLRIAVHLSPRLAATHADLASALVALRKIPEGREEYRQALQIDPENAVARKGLNDLGG